MLWNNKNCLEDFCKHCSYDPWNDSYECKLDYEIKDEWDCPDFEMLERCDNCIHARITVYETGTIDQVDYKCALQDNKFIYSDVTGNPYDPDFPECNIGRFEVIPL